MFWMRSKLRPRRRNTGTPIPLAVLLAEQIGQLTLFVSEKRGDFEGRIWRLPRGAPDGVC
jgi:hypothetical protein